MKRNKIIGLSQNIKNDGAVITLKYLKDTQLSINAIEMLKSYINKELIVKLINDCSYAYYTKYIMLYILEKKVLVEVIDYESIKRIID